MTFIMTNVVTQDEIKELQNLFAKLDTDKDGKLSQQELFQGRQRVLTVRVQAGVSALE